MEISIIGPDSFVNHLTRLKFELCDGAGLNVLEVAICHTSIIGWIDMCHNLGRVKKWPLRCPLCSLFFGRGRELFLRRFQVLRVSDV